MNRKEPRVGEIWRSTADKQVVYKIVAIRDIIVYIEYIGPIMKGLTNQLDYDHFDNIEEFVASSLEEYKKGETAVTPVKTQVKKVHKCTCDMTTLLQGGCKCGGI